MKRCWNALIMLALWVFGGGMLSGLSPDFDLTLKDQYNDLRERVGLALSNDQDSLALRLSDGIPIGQWSPQDRVNRAQARFGMNDWAGVIEEIDRAPRSFRERYFGDFALEYVQSCIKLNRIEHLRETAGTIAVRLNHREALRLQSVFLELFREHQWHLVPLLLDMLPPGIFTKEESALLTATADYYCGNYYEARPQLDSLMYSHHLHIAEAATEYRILLANADNESNFPIPERSLLTLRGYTNLLAFLLREKRFDDAASLALTAPDTPDNATVRALLETKAERYKTAESILAELDPGYLDSHLLTTLLTAEIDAHTERDSAAVTAYHHVKDLLLLNRDRISAPGLDEYLNLALATVHHQERQFDSAVYYLSLNRSQTVCPYDSLALLRIAEIEVSRGHTAEAIANYDSLFAKYPRAANGLRLHPLCELLLNNQQFDRLSLVVDEHRDSLSFEDRLRYVRALGDHFYGRRDYRQARNWYERVPTDLRDDEVAYRYERIRLINGQYSNTEDFYRTFINKYPKNRHSRGMVYSLIRLYEGQNRYQDLADFTGSALHMRSLRVNPDSLVYYRAVALRGLNDDNGSIKLLRRLIKGQGKRSVKQLAIDEMYSLMQQNDPWTAITTFHGLIDSVRDESLRPNLMMCLAQIYDRQGMRRHADEFYQMVLSTGGYRDSLEVYLRLGRHRLADRDYLGAEQYLEMLYRFPSDPRCPEALFLVAEAKMGRGDNYGARQNLLTLIRDFPTDPRRNEALALLARLYYRAGRWDDAWYCYHRYQLAANPYQRGRLDGELRDLKVKVGNDSIRVQLSPDYFRGMLEEGGLSAH